MIESNVSNVSNAVNLSNDEDRDAHPFGQAAWSSAIIAPVALPGGEHPALPTPPWLALTDLGEGGAFTWRDA
ncbi:MAG TPA: hypothetical protein PK095_16360, partial [Myxococcota bacterium]|nr:hypothetical protein [Myxococcota bacterium]